MAEEKRIRFPRFKERLNILKGDMTIKAFAEKIGVSLPTAGFYLNGDRLPDALGVHDIASKCEVSADWLLGLSDVQKSDADLRCVCEYTGLSEQAIAALHTEVAIKSTEFTPDEEDLKDFPSIEKSKLLLKSLSILLSDRQYGQPILTAIGQTLDSQQNLNSLQIQLQKSSVEIDQYLFKYGAADGPIWELQAMQRDQKDLIDKIGRAASIDWQAFTVMRKVEAFFQHNLDSQ